ncbi:hypothetical protein JCM33374_g2085 [Metschnikowia sp. JCM 33374]|nr:hypothetical protein JCM33374_g2085 [Metschnikowia sp. JCM 33374]
MPLNFDLPDSFSRQGHGSTDSSIGQAEEGPGLILELKLALIGNHDLKVRLLGDRVFPGWFRDHLHWCVEGLVSCDVTADKHWQNQEQVSESIPESDFSLNESSGGNIVWKSGDHCSAFPQLFTATPNAKSLLAPVVLETYTLLPLLLELDSSNGVGPESSSTRSFLSENVRYLKSQLDHMLDICFQNSTGDIPVFSPASSTVMPNISLLQNHVDLRMISAMTIAIAQILDFVTDIHILQLAPAEADYLTSDEFHQCLVMLLYLENNYTLNVAALNLFQFRLSQSRHPTNTQEDSMYPIISKIFPRIIELLNMECRTNTQLPGYLRAPISVLSDICLKYPKFCTQLKHTGVDKKLMNDLSRLIDVNSVFGFLQTAKRTFDKTKRVADFSVLKRNVLGSSDEHCTSQKSQLNLIASHMLLLSVFTSSNEDFRRRITSHLAEDEKSTQPNFLCMAIFEIVENYDFLCTQLLLNYKIFWKLQETPQNESSENLLNWLSENVSVLLALLEHPLQSNGFYLIRSLSRSVSTLRTFFVDCNSIRSSFDMNESSPGTSMSSSDGTNKPRSVIANISSRYDRDSSFDEKGNLISCFLKIIGRMASVDQAVIFFASTKIGLPDAQSVTRKAFSEKKVVILATLANFILDFSSFRYKIVNHTRFLRDLATMFKKSIHSKKQCDKKDQKNKEVHEVAYEQLKVQMGILQVIKNYLYNENEENRRIIWDYIPLSLIFELSLYGTTTRIEAELELHKLRLQQKVIAFEILRNLTAASSYFSESIESLYFQFATQEVVNCPITWGHYLLENLLSVGYTNISTFRGADFPHKPVLDVWKRLLGIKLSKTLETQVCGSNLSEAVTLSNHINEVKLSISWILINLTWKEEDYGFSMSQETNFRLMDIISSANFGDASRGSALHDSSIVNENDQEDEEESRDSFNTGDSSRRMDSDAVISSKTRARILYQAGFCQVLESLINDLSLPKPRSGEEKTLSMERFDSLNSNDLYEKCKTAQSQIVSLISRMKERTGSQSHSHSQLPRNHGESHPLRRLSNVAGSRERNHISSEVNRGGEGLGFGSDAEYGSDGTPRTEIPRTESEGTRNEDLEENAQLVEDEEFDEYWIR